MLMTEKIIRSIVREALRDKKRSVVRSISGASKKVDTGDLSGLEFTSVPNKKAAQLALDEFKLWKNGTLKEDEKEAYPILKKYWDDLGDWPESKLDPTETAWSAAFISYVMKKSGDAFFNSAAHATYATKALQNRNKLLKDKKSLSGEQHVLFLKGEAEPDIGDVMFYVREGNIQSWMKSGGGQIKSHTDIFIGGGSGIGGNLSNSCTKSSAMKKHTAIIKKIKI